MREMREFDLFEEGNEGKIGHSPKSNIFSIGYNVVLNVKDRKGVGVIRSSYSIFFIILTLYHVHDQFLNFGPKFYTMELGTRDSAQSLYYTTGFECPIRICHFYLLFMTI